MNVEQGRIESNPEVAGQSNAVDLNQSIQASKQGKRGWSGPTLIELLMVVAAGALVAGIALPARDSKSYNPSPQRHTESAESMRQAAINSWALVSEPVWRDPSSVTKDQMQMTVGLLQEKLANARGNWPMPTGKDTDFADLKVLETTDSKVKLNILNGKNEVVGFVTINLPDFHTTFRDERK